MKKSSSFIKTLILTISNIITGTLTFSFSMILSRKIGPEGMGLYQLVMPVYAMFLCVTGGGITISVSKIAAEKKASGKLNELYRTINVIFIFEVFFSIIITGIVVIMSGVIARNFLSDRRAALSILAFCPALIIISLSSSLKGAYYGLQRVLEPALIDICEKIVRISFMCIFVNLTKNMSLEITTASAVLSLSFGEFTSFMLFLFCYRNFKKKNHSYCKSDNSFQLLFDVLKLAFPLAVNGILSTFFGTVSAVLIPKRLQYAGIQYNKALSIFGKLDGMANTIAFYPTVVLSSVNILLIPLISEAVASKKETAVTRKINTALRIASVVSFSSTAIMLAMPYKLGMFFFKDMYVGELLKMISYGIPIFYLEITGYAILNGMGKQTALLIISTVISLIDLLFMYVFIGIPGINIKGYSISYIISALLGIFMIFYEIKTTYDFKIDFYNLFALPFLCAAFSFIPIFFIYTKLYIPAAIAVSYFTFAAVYFTLYRLSDK